MTLRRCLMTGAVMLMLVAGSAQAAPATALAQIAKAAPVTSQDPMWSDPAPPGSEAAARLADLGYVREEVFLTGTAGGWRAGPEGAIRTRPSQTPYTTRLVVIRPAASARFSGRVHLVPIHPSLGDTPWEWAAPHVLANGDAFVAVMIGGDAPSRASAAAGRQMSAPLVLKPFNGQRYGAINWPNDDSARWEAFSQTAASLKQDDAILGVRAKRIYASGWSFTGSFLRTFINEGFHDLARGASGEPLIDGYLIGISAGGFIAGYVPLDSLSPVRPIKDPVRSLKAIDAPVIELMSQNEALTNTGPQPPNKDSAKGGHRLYELGGLTHGDGLRSTPAPANACPYGHSDVPMSHFARGTLTKLEAWVERGAPPTPTKRIARNTDGRLAQDAYGNVVGGLRSAQLEVPLAAYIEPVEQACAPRAGPSGAYLAIRKVPLERRTLDQLYPDGREGFLTKFDTALEGLKAAGWLSTDDASEQAVQARANAALAFQ